MEAVKIKEGVYWVGAIDWKLRNFHGYSTSRGSTYNAYLIIDDDITLIDTVKAPFAQEMLERISSVCEPEKIKNIIINHAEPDHSGALPRLLEVAKNAKVYASSPNGGKIIRLHYGERTIDGVATGASLNIGKRNLSFVTTPMVHWPDSMVTYSAYDKILFSNDAFGQHIASTERIDKDYDINVQRYEAKKYYANIVLPYSMQVGKAIKALSALEFDTIAPSHGLIWQEHVDKVLEDYEKWAHARSGNKAVIVYDTMWGSTEMIAKAIEDAFIASGVAVRLMDVQNNHISDIITEIVDAKYVCVGSPTLNNGMMPTVASFLCYLKGLGANTGKKYLAFGSFGWGGQSVGLIDKDLKDMNFTQITAPISVQYVPTHDKLREITLTVSEAIKSL